MFVQVIQGQVSDPEQARAALEKWVRELAPGASGWLGSTGGVTDDGRFIAVARFESEEAAQRNNDRPEQGQWWTETSQMFDGEASFSNSTDVTVDTPGNPDEAGFVQIMRGRGSDPERATELMSQDDVNWAELRPDILGTLSLSHDAGEFTMVIYFTSEADAREGEQKEMPPEVQAQMEELNKLMTGPPEFYDLRQPWIYSAR